MEKTHLLRFRLVEPIENRLVVCPTVSVFDFSLKSVIIFHSPRLYGDKRTKQDLHDRVYARNFAFQIPQRYIRDVF